MRERQKQHFCNNNITKRKLEKYGSYLKKSSLCKAANELMRPQH